MSIFGAQGWLAPVIYLSNNVISFLGVLLTTTGGVSWLFVLPVHFGEGGTLHPYLGILFFLVLPTLFFTGLALIPLGIYLRWRKLQHRWDDSRGFPPLNWRNREFRNLVTFVGLATGANVIIAGHSSYAAVEYMDSVTFCGQTCHTVMAPEFTAHQDSPHSRVGCVDCHVGEGASWFAKSKLNGLGQVFAVAFDTYPRPIPTPVHNLRPARETCEACHWREKAWGNRLRIWDKFGEDEQNTLANNVLLMRIGGGTVENGIHGFHLTPGALIEYASDPTRQNIPWVRYVDSSGQSTEYFAEGWTPNQEAELERRTMDCIDCHNRPTHTFELPDRALDTALSEGRIDASLPMVKKQGVEILRAEYSSGEAARATIPRAVEDFYRGQYPETYETHRDAILGAGRELLTIYDRNVFPEMNVTWGTYPNNVGHTAFLGCYRCHDDLHSSEDGRTITQDCSACHELLAIEETDPEILTSLGIRQ